MYRQATLMLSVLFGYDQKASVVIRNYCRMEWDVIVDN